MLRWGHQATAAVLIVFAAVMVLAEPYRLKADERASPLFLNGHELSRFCVSEELINRSFCRGYLIGVSDGSILERANSLVCLLEVVTVGQIVGVVVTWIRKHPEKRHMRATVSALRNEFPCP